MSKNVNRKFTLDLDISTKNAEAKVKAMAGEIKTLLADLGGGKNNKMGVFKELADYLNQIDEQITLFKKKHGDGLFEQIFGGLDANLRNEVEKIFGTTREQISQIEAIRAKIFNAKKNGISGDEMSKLETELKELYSSIGMKGEAKLTGKGKIATRLSNLEKSLNNFALVWEDVNGKVSKGFAFGGSGENANIASILNIEKRIKDTEKKIETLKNVQTELDEVSIAYEKLDEDEGLFESVTAIDATVEAVKELAIAYEAAMKKKEAFDINGDTSSKEYYENELKLAKMVLQAREIVDYQFEQYEDLEKELDLEDLNGKSLHNYLDDMSGMYDNILDDISSTLRMVSESLQNELDALKRGKAELEDKGKRKDPIVQAKQRAREINELKSEIDKKIADKALDDKTLGSYIQKVGELSSGFRDLAQSAGLPEDEIKGLEGTLESLGRQLTNTLDRVLKNKGKNPIDVLFDESDGKLKDKIRSLAKFDKEYKMMLGTTSKMTAFDNANPSDIQREYILEAFREYQKISSSKEKKGLPEVAKMQQLLRIIGQASIDKANTEDYQKIYGIDGDELKAFVKLVDKKEKDKISSRLSNQSYDLMKEARNQLINALREENEEVADLIMKSSPEWNKFLAGKDDYFGEPANIIAAMLKTLESKAAKKAEEQKNFNELKTQFDNSIKDFTDTGIIDVAGNEQNAYNAVLDGIRNKTIKTVDECKAKFAELAKLDYDELAKKNEELISQAKEQGAPIGGVSDKISQDVNESKKDLKELQRIRDECISIINSLGSSKKTKISINDKNDTTVLSKSLKNMQQAFATWATSKNGTEEQIEAYGRLIDAAKKYQSVVGFIKKSGSQQAKELLYNKEVVGASRDADAFLGSLDAKQKKAAKTYFEKLLGTTDQDISAVLTGNKATSNISQTGDAAKKAAPKVKTLTDEFNEYIASIKNAGNIKWDDNIKTAYKTVFDGIKKNTFATVEECKAKFRELANITEVIRGAGGTDGGSGAGSGSKGASSGSGTGSGGTNLNSGMSSGSGTGESVDTSALQQTISTEAGKIITKLNGTLKVEIVKDSSNANIQKEVTSQQRSKQESTKPQTSVVESIYNSASEEQRKLVDQWHAAIRERVEFAERTKGAVIEGFDPTFTSDLHKNIILEAYKKYKNVVQEISNMPIVKTDDDKKKLQELQEEAMRLQATLAQAHRPDGTISSYNDYGLSGSELEDFFKTIHSKNLSGEKIRQEMYAYRDKINNAPSEIWAQFDDLIKSDKLANAEQWKKFSLDKYPTEFVVGDLQKNLLDKLMVAAQESMRKQQEEALKVAKKTELKDNFRAPFTEMMRTLSFDDATDDAYDEVIKGIDDGILTTLDQCNAKFEELSKTSVNDLASLHEKVLVIQSVADAYDDMADAQDDGNQKGYDDAMAKVNKFKEQYDGFIATMRDGSKVRVNFDDEFESAVNNVLDNTDKLRSIEMIPNTVHKEQDITNIIDEKTDAFNKEKSTVDTVVSAEIQQLENLRVKLEVIKDAVEAKTCAFEEERVAVDAAVDAEMTQLNALLELLKQITAQIGILNDGFSNTGKNVIASSGNITVTHATEKEYALESTLNQTNTILNSISDKLTQKNDFSDLIEPLKTAAAELKNVADGIIQHQKAQKSNTSAAMARISDPKKHQMIVDVASNSIGDLGSDVQIKSLKALANGIVSVEGAFKNANDEWEGFTVKVNESNKAVDLAINKQSAFAKALSKVKVVDDRTDDNPHKISASETEKRAFLHAMGYADQGEDVTIRYQDNERYTVALRKNIGALQKEVFQTFDDSIADFDERTTVTISTKTQAALKNTNKFITENMKLLGDNKAVTEYTQAYADLLQITNEFQTTDDLSDSAIEKWNKQIDLVNNLGTAITNLIKIEQKRDPEKEAKKADDAVFSKMKEKKKNIGKYQTNLAGLDEKSEADIPVINEIKETLVVLNNEYDALEKQLKKPLSTEQLKELSEIAEKTADDIRLARAKMEGSIAAKDKKDIKKADDDAAKEAQKEVDAAFSKMEKKKRAIGTLEVALAKLDKDSEKDAPKIAKIVSVLERLNQEYDELEGGFGEFLSREQVDKLNSITQEAADKVGLAKAEKEGANAAKEKEDAFKRLLAIFTEMGKIDTIIASLDTDEDVDEINDLTNALHKLKEEYDELYNSFENKFTPDQINALDKKFVDNLIAVHKATQKSNKAKKKKDEALAKKASDDELFELDRGEKLSQFDLDIARLRTKGEIDPKHDVDKARKEIEDAADKTQLDKAMKAWKTLKNEIQEARIEAERLREAQPILDTKKLQTYSKDAEKIMNSLNFGINDTGLNDRQKTIIEAYKKLISLVDTLKKSNKELTDSERFDLSAKFGWFESLAELYNEDIARQKEEEARVKAPQDKFKADLDYQLDAFDKYEKDLEGAGYLTTELSNKIEELKAKLISIDNTADLTAWQNEFKELSHEVDIAKAQFTGKHNNIAKGYKGQIDDAMNGLGIDTNSDDLNDKQKEIVDLYDKASAAVTAYKENAQQGNEVEASGIRETIKLLKEKADQYRKDNDISNVNPKNFGATATRRETTRYGRLSEISKSEGYSDSEEFKTKFSEYEKKYKELKELQEKFANSDILTNEEVKQWDELKDIVANMGKELEKSVRASEKLRGNNDWEALGPDFMDNKEGREKALTDYINNLEDATVQSIDFKDNYKKCVALIKDSDGSFKKVTATIDTFGNRIVSNMNDAGESISNVQKFIDLAKVKFGQIFAYMAASFGIQEVIQEVRRGITYIKEIDDALTELKKVTNETDAEYQHFLQNMSKTASVVGSTVTDLTRSAADWARLGYSMNEAGKLAATTAKLLNVSEFESVDDATSALVSSLQAFNKDGYDAAQRAEEIVDILNNIGNKYPVATNELASGLASSGAALVAANNSIEEQVAMLAAGNATMQDISSVASGLKIVAARLRGTTSEADDDAESAVTNVSKLQEKIKTLTAEANGGEGIDIINEDGSYKSTWEILTAISEIFDKMDDMSQASLLELIAGKNRSSVVAAILQNGDILKEAYSDAFDSKGSAQKELDTYLDSIQGKVDKFTTSLQTMWMNLISSDFIKWVVDLGTALITVLDKIGLFPTALIGIVGYFSLIKKISPVGIFKELGGVISGYTSAIERLNSLSQSGFDTQTITSYAQAVSGLSAEKQALALAGAGLNRQQIQEVLTKNQVSDATIEQIMSEGQLAAAKNLTTTATLGEAVAIAGVTVAQENEAASTWLAANSSKQLTLDLLHEAVAHGAIKKEVAEEIAVKNGLIATNLQAASTSSSLWKTFTAMPLLGKISLIVTAVSAIFTIGKKIYDYFNPSTEELVQKWDDLKNEIDNVNSELETTQSRIDELNSKGVLSITDKQELQQLKQTNDELERRLRLTEQNAEDAGNKAKKAVKKDYEKEFVFAPVVTNKAKKEYNEAYNAQRVIDSMKAMPDFSTWETMEQYQKDAFANLDPDLYKKIIGKAFYDLDEITQEEFFDFEAKLAKQMSDLESSALGLGAVSGEEYIDQSIQRIKELKDELYDTSGQIRPNIDDEYAKEVYDQITELENGLIAASGDLYNYMDQYGGDAGDAFVRNLQAQIDKIDMTVNPVEFYGKKFDEILGKYSDKKVELYKLAEAGELSADVLNGLSYKPLMSELTKLGITAQDVVNHIRSLSATDISKVTSPEFNIADYANDIDSIQENISTLQSALESLESGTFTYSDFIDLTQQFPDLAKGVDTSSKSFNGLARNLKRAIKASPDELVDELKDLKKQLQANGRSTVAIDQLIDSIENLPVESVTNLSDEYVTLTNKINAAKQAQNELQEAMSENPNEGYETRGEAMEYMKDKMKRGEIGSESELWDVAEQYGFTYDSAKSINENADALAEFIAIREQWFAKNDDGDYTFTGTEDFIQSVENAISSEDFKTAMAEAGLALEDFIWSYDDATGAFNFDFDNANWDAIVNALSKTKELAGLTSEEFHDMLVQIGQYFGFNWEDYNDIETHLKTIADGTSDAKTKVKEYGEVMQAGFGKDTKIDLTNRPRIDIGDGQYETVDSRAYSNEEGTVAITVTPILPDGTKLTDEDLEKYANDIINGADPATYEFEVNGKSYTGDDIVLGKHFGDDSIEQANEFGQALHNAQEEYYALVDEAKNNPLSIKTDGDVEKDIINPLREVGLKVEEIFDEAGNKQFKLDVVDLETLLRDEGYTTENIMAIVNRIFGEGSENSKLVQLREDILNIDKVSGEVLNTLDKLGATYGVSGTSQGAHIYIDSNINTLLSNLHFTDAEIATLKEKWEQNGIIVRTESDTSGVEDSQEALDKQPENVTTTVDLDTAPFHEKIKPVFNDLDKLTRPRTATVTINTVTKETTTSSKSSTKFTPYRQNTMYADGTAHAQGSWGAKESGTSLVGELGPEILVRNGRWTTVGDNGAEFTQVKKGDIIFNHKQTEDLLSKGYITGRGKMHGGNSAFANGTAFVDGGSTFASYDFDGKGGYTKYDANDNAADKISDAADKISDAADKTSDAADEFHEVFDWVEVRLEEIDENLGLLSAQLENASNYSAKNNIVDSMIGANKNKIENLAAGIAEYTEYASKLLNEVPSQFRDAAQNGAIAIKDFAGDANEKTVEAINNYREWAQKVADLKQQLEEVKTEIRDLARQKFDNIYEAGNVRATVEDSQTEKLQNAVDLIEESGKIATEEYYKAMMENSNKTIEYLTKTRDEMQKVFNEAVEAGIIVRGSNEWYEMVDELYQIDAEIDGATKELEEFQNAINDIYWSNFDQLINRLDYLKDETQNLIDLMDDVDLVDDNGDWTDEGLASLGLYAQQIEIAEYQSKQYAEAIDDLTADFEAGLYSEDEYMEKLAELKDAQYDSIEAYDEAKKAIVDLNKTRVDAIKKGIEKEIDAYEELIEKKKEALDSEKDLYDFQRSTMEQQKTISEIERQLAALANDTSLSAVARRKQLEAELAEAQYELQDTYYNRSVEDKQSALDKELESFRAEKEAEIEAWDEYLTNIEMVVAESLGIVQENATSIYDTLMAKAEEYDLTISDAIMTPWQDGSFAVSDYQEQFNTAMSSTMNQLEALKNKWQEVIDKMLEASKAEVSGIHNENNNYVSAEKKQEQTQNPSGSSASNNKPNEEKTIKVGGKINASGAKIYSSIGSKGQNQYYSKDPVYVVLEEKSGYLKVRHHSLKSGVTGWFKKSDIKAYAKGSLGVDKDQLALIDELGEELQLVPGKNGRLEYIKKGTAIVPADLTNRLIDLAMDPQEMLDRNRPTIGASPSIVTNTIEVNMNISEVVHIDKVDNDTIPDLTKAVRKEMDSYMVKLNNAIKSKVR